MQTVMASVSNKVCLVVIDGWGLSEEVKGIITCSVFSHNCYVHGSYIYNALIEQIESIVGLFIIKN